MHHCYSAALACLVGFLNTSTAFASNFTLTPNDAHEAVFAVLTEKGGALKGLAHNHLVVATDVNLSVGGTRAAPTVSLSLPTESLLIDDAKQQAKLYPRLKELGLVNDPYEALGDSDRATIRTNMLAKDQLNAKEHPTIRAALLSLSGMGAPVELTIGGVTVKKTFTVNITELGSAIEVEAWTPRGAGYAFRDFGITPFSKLLGTLRVKDDFMAYAKFRVKQ